MSVVLFAVVIAGIATAASASLMKEGRRRWIRSVQKIESDLVVVNPEIPEKHELPAVEPNVRAAKQTWESLPAVVQKYLRMAFLASGDDANVSLNDTSKNLQPIPPMIQTLRFNQEGQFSTTGGSSWLAFTASQTVSAQSEHPGFVWRAEIDTVPKKAWLSKIAYILPKILVCDAWVKGEGHLMASLHGLLSLASDEAFVEHRKQLQQGEMMRWLAEAFLIPTALLPEANLVTWKAMTEPEYSSRGAILSMTDEGTGVTAEVSVFFSDDEITVKGVRPKATGRSFVNLPWGGRLSRLQCYESMLIPTHMECGWINEETKELDLYFIADNADLKTEMVPNVSSI